MSIHVCVTLTYDIQMLICYQNELKFLKIVYFEGSYLHLYKLFLFKNIQKQYNMLKISLLFKKNTDFRGE